MSRAAVTEDAPEELAGAEVRAYCDLHKRVSSVQSLRGDQKGRVVAKPRRLVLEGVRFEVSAAGLRRCRAEGVRNVHAYARGTVHGSDVEAITMNPAAVRVRYNPHAFSTFVRGDTEEPISGAAYLAIEGKTAWGLGLIAA
ncbi:hypothetical protein [Sphingosinicella sp. BN140058]|uniref:hypothetical protein n=1 Tax=Sphingosinicella sp. BN140058 TaxID=1892855 RepID=UPI0010118132|nr:hypothetical protein [Sphingosinicella sp. BN140058]QAY80361.1 hypothetical protein ETR14_27355 [Sphingosinicella sp. BN140058]